MTACAFGTVLALATGKLRSVAITFLLESMVVLNQSGCWPFALQVSEDVSEGLRRRTKGESAPNGLVRRLPEIVWHLAKDSLHHREVLDVLVRLEERLAGKELDEDAPDRPDVALVRPTGPYKQPRASEAATMRMGPENSPRMISGAR